MHVPIYRCPSSHPPLFTNPPLPRLHSPLQPMPTLPSLLPTPLHTSSPLPRLHPPVAGILSLQHMPGPSGKGSLVSAGRDGTVRVWQLDEGTGVLSRWGV